MIVTNVTRQKRIADKVFAATNFWERMKGLIGTSLLKEGEGLLLPNCMGVHTFGMKYDLDVIYLNKDGEVIACYESLKPNQFGHVKMNSTAVLEFRPGTIRKSKTEVGDQLVIDGIEEVEEQIQKAAIPTLRFI